MFDWMMVGYVGILLAACAHRGIAQDQATTKADAVAPAPSDPKAFPPYFLGTNQDPDKPLSPDPSGTNWRSWGTPSPGQVGDGDLQSKTVPELYDRIAHNLLSVNFVWVLVTGFLVMFMQAGVALVLHFRRLGGQGGEGFQ